MNIMKIFYFYNSVFFLQRGLFGDIVENFPYPLKKRGSINTSHPFQISALFPENLILDGISLRNRNFEYTLSN